MARYAIQMGEGGPVKLGVAASPEFRFKAIAGPMPCPCRMLGVQQPSGSEFAAEKALHRRFGHLRLRGEWFRPERELLAFIEANFRPCDVEMPEERVLRRPRRDWLDLATYEPSPVALAAYDALPPSYHPVGA